MGNGFAKHITRCFSITAAGGAHRRRIDSAAVTSEPFFDEGLGHSFCYVSSNSSKMLQSDPNPDPIPNPNPAQFYSISGASVSANPSTALSAEVISSSAASLSASAFDSSTSFASYPLYPVPRYGPDRAFLSGPIDGGFLSGPLDPRAAASVFSGPLDHPNRGAHHLPTSLRRSISNGGRLIRTISNKMIGRTISGPAKISKDSSSVEIDGVSGSSLQWAQGKAGEDRVHVVVSEEHGWVFVGIYDGFNGPDATDYLLSNLYSNLQQELKGVLWIEEPDGRQDDDAMIKKKRKKIRWKCDWEKENLDNERLRRSRSVNSASHGEVLKSMNQALRKTEEGFFEVSDKMAAENPELALMGSCVLAMLMKGEDVYVMNVGDSRAVLGQKPEIEVKGKGRQDLGRISEESFRDDGRDWPDLSPSLAALQLTLDHSTCDEEEVRRIRGEHPDDACSVMNDRVKGSLKVTRAFGAGFLKQPKWNDALLEMFRIDYVGTSPYITCNPFLHYHRLGPKDRFLILSSDGLYQYFTNEEAVAQVELFIATTPEGDPAQHLVEEVIFRAANKAGLDFYELLEIPQGDRRRYHDDVSIIVISFDGRIWRSCV